MTNGGGAAWTFPARKPPKTSVTLQGRLRVSAAEGFGWAYLPEWASPLLPNGCSPRAGVGTVKAVLQDWSLPSLDFMGGVSTGRQASAKARVFAISSKAIGEWQGGAFGATAGTCREEKRD